MVPRGQIINVKYKLTGNDLFSRYTTSDNVGMLPDCRSKPIVPPVISDSSCWHTNVVCYHHDRQRGSSQGQHP